MNPEITYERGTLHTGWAIGAVDGGGATLTDKSGSAVTLGVDRIAFGGVNLGDLEIVASVGSEEYSAFRPVTGNGGGYRFGSPKASTVDNAPLLVDVTTPAGVLQVTVLGCDADSLAILPYVPLSQD